MSLRINDTAPDFTLTGIDGRRLTLSSLRGRIVVLTFFASWCHPCEEDMPALQRAQADNAGRKPGAGSKSSYSVSSRRRPPSTRSSSICRCPR